MFAFYCGLETTEATLLVARQQEREGSFRFEGFFDGLTYGLAGRLLFDTASSHAVLSANITAGRSSRKYRLLGDKLFEK